MKGFDLDTQQETIRLRCFHSSGRFTECSEEVLNGCLSARFEEVARKYPEKVAVKSDRYSLTYYALNEKANQIARTILKSRGGGGHPIGICVRHDGGMVAAVLGVLKTGNFYVPLDPNDPPTRTGAMIEESDVETILADDSTVQLIQKLAPHHSKILNIDAIDSSVSRENVGLAISPDALAYILYTSGSTGKPKAVMQTHRNLLQQTLVYTNTLHITPEDRMSLLHSCSKGACTPHLFSSLLSGAALYPFDVKEHGIARLADLLRDESLTVYHSIPAVFRTLVHSMKNGGIPCALRVVHLSGDRATPSDVELYKQTFQPDCIFVHRLGSSEANTVFLYLIDMSYRAEGETLPVGKAIRGKEIHLLDDEGSPVSDGEIGEIVIRSRYLSPGYWRDPERTAAVFQTCPDGGARIFRTGDMGRQRGDGTVEHLGRKDAQVKIRGYRIDTGEVEAAILNYGGLTEVAVVARDNDRADKELVAYLVSAVKPVPLPTDLRQFLGSILPSYMIPVAFVFLKSLPSLPNGKIDRQALREAAFTRTAVNVFVPARTPVEEALVEIWSKALGVSRVGTEDNFFDLGGHSLTVTRVLGEIEAVFDVRLEPKALFDNPTIEGLSLALTEELCAKGGLR